MEVDFTPEQLASLSQVARHHGTNVTQLVKNAALRVVENDAQFRAAVQRGIEQADQGEFIEEEDMDTRVARMFQS